MSLMNCFFLVNQNHTEQTKKIWFIRVICSLLTPHLSWVCLIMCRLEKAVQKHKCKAYRILRINIAISGRSDQCGR